MADDAVSASAKGASFLILVQIASKVLTFGLNQLLLRYLSPSLLGAAVQLELYKIGVLYFSRESLRVATERRSSGGVQVAVNLSYLAILAGLPFGYGFSRWFLHVGYPDVPLFVQALRVNQAAAFVELLSEPAFVTVQQKMLFKIRATAEVPGLMMKAFTTAALVFWGQQKGMELGVFPFACGELANSTTMTLLYLYRTSCVAKRDGFSLLPRKLNSSPNELCVSSLLSKPLLWLSVSLYFQTAIKWALTEGDKLLVAAFASLEARGMYALSANYGGFLARMVFKPIEESSRNLFANLCSAASVSETPSSKTQQPPKPQTNPNITTAAQILHRTLRLYALLSLPVFALGPHAFPLLLRLAAGSHWSNTGAGRVFGTYSYYIPLLAINGVSEAFVAATATTSDLRLQSLWMGLFSFLFTGSAWFFLRVLDFGAEGLVWANCINMALRIVFNLSFAQKFLTANKSTFNPVALLPNVYAIGIAAIAAGTVEKVQCKGYFEGFGLLREMAPVAVVGAAVVAALAAAERKFLRECFASFAGEG